MFLGALLAGYYDLYVALFSAAVQLAVFLSLLVSADRVLNIAKYLYVKARQRVTGNAPEDYWHFKPLPQDVDDYPKVRRAGRRRQAGRRRRAAGRRVPALLAIERCGA